MIKKPNTLIITEIRVYPTNKPGEIKIIPTPPQTAKLNAISRLDSRLEPKDIEKLRKKIK